MAAPGSAPAFGFPVEERTGRLQGLEGPVENQEYALDRAETSIGRRSDCNIPVTDQSVSRLHARIQRVPEGFLVEDAGSANGTWVNGVRLSGPRLLADQDIVRIGNAGFRFRLEAPVQPLPPGAMTMVADLGDEPAPFGTESINLTPPGPRPQAAPSPPPSRPREAFAPPPAVRPPAPVAPSIAPGPPVDSAAAVREELSKLRCDLGPFIKRLNALADSISALESRPAGVAGLIPSEPAPALRRLLDEIEAEDGDERYRELQRLLDELRSSPTDLRLLLRLSDELPAISRLLQIYLQVLSALRGPR